MKTVTAAEANRRFSAVLREVSQGQEMTIVSRGKPVATIGPVKTDSVDRRISKKNLISRLKKNDISGSRNWTRNELYDDWL
ncbi:MAG: type II toxin-antitoxin system prevent-host-death family antitoxin [Deltaproteobacteria bacterium]|jgi:prevent-host-death family protein|nr:type II toxin-antitoxin system prevent-host-death family antitoxin [Deltaproteobacteria bacterium]